MDVLVSPKDNKNGQSAAKSQTEMSSTTIESYKPCNIGLK